MKRAIETSFYAGSGWLIEYLYTKKQSGDHTGLALQARWLFR